MKIIFVDAYYPVFLKVIEEKISKKGLTDYSKIKKELLGYKFGTSDFYSNNLRLLGIETNDVVINSGLLQKAWSRQHKPFLYFMSLIIELIPKIKNVYHNFGNPLVLLAQIKEYKPDVVYVQCVGTLPPPITKLIKRRCKLLVGQIASKFPPDNYFKNYDLILSSLPNMIERIEKLGIKSEYLPLAFEKTLLKSLKSLPSKKYDITHVGGYGPIHNERNRILEYAAKKVKIDFWGYGINNLPKDSPILKSYYGEAWGLEMYKILAQSKITLTSHITKVAGKYANNMTLYEATGCGTLLITDAKKNLGELFKIDKEIVTYRTPEEMVRKIRYYLKHDSERIRIAKAGQKRTLKNHNYYLRMKQLMKILGKYLG